MKLLNAIALLLFGAVASVNAADAIRPSDRALKMADENDMSSFEQIRSSIRGGRNEVAANDKSHHRALDAAQVIAALEQIAVILPDIIAILVGVVNTITGAIGADDEGRRMLAESMSKPKLVPSMEELNSGRKLQAEQLESILQLVSDIFGIVFVSIGATIEGLVMIYNLFFGGETRRRSMLAGETDKNDRRLQDITGILDLIQAITEAIAILTQLQMFLDLVLSIFTPAETRRLKDKPATISSLEKRAVPTERHLLPDIGGAISGAIAALVEQLNIIIEAIGQINEAIALLEQVQAILDSILGGGRRAIVSDETKARVNEVGALTQEDLVEMLQTHE